MEVIHDPVMGQRYRLTGKGDVLRNELAADPGSEVPEHFHPRIEERFEILEGDWTFLVDGEERRARPGDRLTVPAGAPHKFANMGSEVGRFIAEIEPAMDMEGFFMESAALARAGMFSRPGIPNGLRGALAASEFAERYKDTTVMLFPPRPVQRLVFPVLAGIERRRRGNAPRTT